MSVPRSEHHHNVYMVLLDPAVGKIRRIGAENPDRDPAKPCVYVGMSGLPPEFPDRWSAGLRAGAQSGGRQSRSFRRALPKCGGRWRAVHANSLHL